jgi:hypothetical protein
VRIDEFVALATLLLDYARRMCGGTEAVTIAPIPQFVRGWREVAQEYEEIYRKQFMANHPSSSFL